MGKIGIESGVSWSVGHESDRYKTEIVLYISSYIILIIMGGIMNCLNDIEKFFPK